MDRKRAWVIPLITGATTLVIFFFSQGGVAGMARNPTVTFAVFAALVLIETPLLWLNYRRIRRDPILVPVAEMPPSTAGVFGEAELPAALTASRWKIAVRIVYILIGGGAFLCIGLVQPGVCRTVSLVGYMPLILWNLGLTLLCLWAPEHLFLQEDGLRSLEAGMGLGSMGWCGRESRASGRIVLPEPIRLVHPFVQDRHDANAAVAEQFPVDEVLLIPADVSVDAELGRDRAPGEAVVGDGLEALEQAADVAFGLGLAKRIACVGVDLVQAAGGAVLDLEGAQAGARGALRAITWSASSGR